MEETFSDWCFNNKHLKGSVGDFCNDWADDDTKPDDPKSFEEVWDYLHTLNPCQGAVEAAPLAWAKFKEFGNR